MCGGETTKRMASQTLPRFVERDLEAQLFFSFLFFLFYKQGFVGVPGDARWFFQHVQMVVPLEARAFYQVIRPELPCAWYFDVDGSDPTFNMVRFLDAMFEEMAKELVGNCGFEITSETIWTTTLLTDASSNVAGNKRKTSCHGTCPTGNIVFSDNRTTMKEFAHRLLYRLETRSDNASLRVLDKKTGTMVIPLDVSVYDKHRCFRTTGSSKMSGDAAECRPLTLASYNRYPLDEKDDKEALYLLSLISQTHPVTVHVVNSSKSHGSNKKGKGIKRERRPTVAAPSSSSSSVISSSPALESFLLGQARAWGNPDASVSTVAPQNNSPNAGLYVAFSNATAASDHKHDSNNIYALVDLTSLTVHWRCHQGSQKLCKTHFSQELSMDIALSITSTKKQK